MNIITIAIPKGRLTRHILKHFKNANINLKYNERTLITQNETHGIKILFVKNDDLLEYVYGGIADIGIAGSDILYESSYSFFSLGTLPFGQTRICLISTKNQPPINTLTYTKVASKYIKFTKHFLLSRGIHAKLIPLHGSVELAPLLKLAPYIIDLVETGSTIKENNLVISEEIGRTEVKYITNKALYKLNYKAIDNLVRKLKL